VRRTVLVLAIVSGCSFSPSGATGGDDDDDDDGSISDGAERDSGPPIDGPCHLGFVDVCASGAPAGPLVVAGNDTIDTDTDPRCATYPQPGGPDACLVWVASVSIPGGTRLTGVGSRPLLLASAGDILIDGVLDVASRRGQQIGAGAGTGPCAMLAPPDDDLGGAGGASGGGFGTVGGDGGTGDTDMSLGADGNAAPGVHGAVIAAPGFARGGCAGQTGGAESAGGGPGGVGGASGGAVILAAFGELRIRATGQVLAGGAGGSGGGEQAGGGGGGSGGYVGLEGAVIEVAGAVAANGGGGGGGGARVNGNPVMGGGGGDGGLGALIAAGGPPAFDATGGTGAGGAIVATAGVSSIVGGAGGGGGLGVVAVRGTVGGAGSLSPAPTGL
jgi:hypothetical protein